MEDASIRTLGEARASFWHRRSPKLLAAAVVGGVGLRIALGGLGWRDAVAAAALLVIYPFGEWATHVYLLHARPIKLGGGRRWELPTTAAHREHHERPNDLDMVLLAPIEVAGLLLLAIPLVVWVVSRPVALLAGGIPLEVLVSAVVMGWIAVAAYEWCHFLIHTAHRPRTRVFRSVWRSHRLHHFKNERYWHGVTSNIADRVLGTYPEQGEVPRSRTARTLRT